MAAARTAERSMIERGLVVYAGGLKRNDAATAVVMLEDGRGEVQCLLMRDVYTR